MKQSFSFAALFVICSDGIKCEDFYLKGLWIYNFILEFLSF